MSVASWLRSVFTTQDPATYKSAIDGNFTVLERLAAMFAPSQAATPNMTVVIRPGMILDNGTLTEMAQQTTTAFTAPATNPRIDRIVLDQRTGAYAVVAGTPAVSPVPPAIPAGKMPCAQVLLQPSSASITNSMITDERVFVSLSQASIAALFAPLASPTFTDIPNAPTANPGTNTTQIASCAFAVAGDTAVQSAAASDATTKANNAQSAAAADATAKANNAVAAINSGAAITGGTINSIAVTDFGMIRTSNVTPLPAVGTSYVVSHSLGVVPKYISFEIVCLTAEQGYSVGDVVKITSLWNGTTGFYQNAAWGSSTQVGFLIAAADAIYLISKSALVAVTPTAANWAYRFVLSK